MSEHVITEVIDGIEQHYTVPKNEWDFHHDNVPRMMQDHLGGSLDLTLLPHQPIRYPEQRLEVTHQDVNPLANLATIRTLANQVLGEERVDEFIDVFRSRPDLVDAQRMDMDRGLRTGTLTNHRIIHDVAVAHGLRLLAIGEERFVSSGALIMSKAITRLEVDTGIFGRMPATEALSFVVASFFSIPLTKSSYNVEMHPEIAKQANPPMIASLEERMPHGTHLTVAGSGSTDKEKDGVITMQRLGNGTTRLLAGLDRILPIALDITAPTGEAWFKIGRYTDMAAGKPEQTHAIMELIASDLAEITGKTVRYEDVHFFETEEYQNAKARLQQAGEKAQEAGKEAARKVSEWLEEWKTRRNKRWDDRH